jgi:aminomethyltransferase
MLRTECYDWHVAHNGRMVEFAGWEMPVQYTSIVAEHQAVRTRAGLFDIAHMGRLRLAGPDAGRYLDALVTIDVTALKVGDVRYALVTNEAGGILDDVLVYRFEGSYLMVVNASNREKIVSWLSTRVADFDVTVNDVTFEQFMLAVQGPLSAGIVQSMVDVNLTRLKYYTAIETSVVGVPAIISRTGYTGEEGFEVILPSARGLLLWETLLERGAEQRLQAAGLGCRDTLRLEAGMPLYGHELDESIDPFTAGLSFAVKLDAGDFVGRNALVTAKAKRDRPRRVGLVLEGRRIAREGATILSQQDEVGRVTSGTFSPTMEKAIAMAYVDRDQAEPGNEVEVDIRGKRVPAKVVKLPFYSRR